MDFAGMKRKDLQRLCKKHGIPRTLKNSEMVCRLASVFQENAEDSVEAPVMKGKKVTFSPDDDEVFEFTPSVMKCPLQQGGRELRRSKRNIAKEIPVAGSYNESESNTGREVSGNGTKQECNLLDVSEEVHKVTRRSKRIGGEVTELMALDKFEDKKISKEDGFKLETVSRRSTRLAANLVNSCVGGETLKVEPFSSDNQSKQLIDTGDKDDEIVKTNVKEVSTGFEVQETRKYHRKDDPQVEKVLRRSKRFVNVETNT